MADLTIRLPGDSSTGLAALVICCAVAAWRVRGRVSLSGLWIGIPTIVLTGAMAVLPFAANRRVGVIGVTVDDDMVFHMAFADGLSRGQDVHSLVQAAYPLGPHSFVAALDALGLSTEPVFIGFIVGLFILTGLTALEGLSKVPARVRPIAAASVGSCYLAAAYLVQSSFKETMMAVFLLGFALLVRDVATRPERWRRAMPATLVLVFGALVTYSVPAIVWFVAIGAAGLVATMIAQRIRPTLQLVGAIALVGAGLLATVIGFELLTGFFRHGAGRYALVARTEASAQAGGNLPRPISFFEVFGVWHRADFRFEPVGGDWHVGVALAIAATLVGAARLARRDIVLPATAAGMLATYAASVQVSLAYNAAKALMLAAPFVMLTALAGLLAPARTGLARLGLAVAAASLVVAAGSSSSFTLRSALVRPSGQSTAIGDFRKDVVGHRTAFLGRDNYATWELRKRIGTIGSGGRAYHFGGSPEAGAAPNVGLDSLTTGELNYANRVITPRTLYASFPGPDLRLVRTTRWYRLYKRVGPSPQRLSVGEGREPGAVLDCASPHGKLLEGLARFAFLRPPPVVGRASAWRDAAGRLMASGGRFAFAGNRERFHQTLALPPGRWEISLNWIGSVTMGVLLDGRYTRLPPYLSDDDRFWRVGSVRGGRRVSVDVQPGGERRIDVPRTAAIGAVAAVRENQRGHYVKFKAACGRYVDWVLP